VNSCRPKHRPDLQMESRGCATMGKTAVVHVGDDLEKAVSFRIVDDPQMSRHGVVVKKLNTHQRTAISSLYRFLNRPSERGAIPADLDMKFAFSDHYTALKEILAGQYLDYHVLTFRPEVRAAKPHTLESEALPRLRRVHIDTLDPGAVAKERLQQMLSFLPYYGGRNWQDGALAREFLQMPTPSEAGVKFVSGWYYLQGVDRHPLIFSLLDADASLSSIYSHDVYDKSLKNGWFAPLVEPGRMLHFDRQLTAHAAIDVTNADRVAVTFNFVLIPKRY
jgi:hypothetical protein